LTERGGVCYYNSMEENTQVINNRIAKNLTLYRKRAGLTQAELAEKINYSDKSVSKWESGNGIPDVYVLIQLAEIFDVTVNDLLASEDTKPVKQKTNFSLHTLIMALSSGIVWLVATCVFVLLNMIPNVEGDWWLAFIFALPVNAIVLVVFSGVWKYKFLNFLSVSLTVWTTLLAAFCALRFILNLSGAAGLIFILGAPLQVLEILWAFFRYSVFKKKHTGGKN